MRKGDMSAQHFDDETWTDSTAEDVDKMGDPYVTCHRLDLLWLSTLSFMKMVYGYCVQKATCERSGQALYEELKPRWSLAWLAPTSGPIPRTELSDSCVTVVYGPTIDLTKPSDKVLVSPASSTAFLTFLVSGKGSPVPPSAATNCVDSRDVGDAVVGLVERQISGRYMLGSIGQYLGEPHVQG